MVTPPFNIEQVDANLRQLTGKPVTQECNLSNAGSDLSSLASTDPRRLQQQQQARKEVSFSLDEDNNMKTAQAGGATLSYEAVSSDSLEAIPEVTHSQVRGPANKKKKNIIRKMKRNRPMYTPWFPLPYSPLSDVGVCSPAMTARIFFSRPCGS
jgi:hypothetical protein